MKHFPLPHLLVFLVILSHSSAHIRQSKYNVGWEKYLADEPTTFHNLPLTWEEDAPLPSWLVGSYIKNGPSRRQFGTEERWYSQYMDSWAKLNKVTFTATGEALFSGRMIESVNYLRCVEADKMVPSITIAGVAPNDWSPTEMMSSLLHGYDNTNVILWRLGPEDPQNATYIATSDVPLVNMIDPESLAVTGQLQPNPFPDGISMGSSSHWRRELGTDNSLNFHMIVNPLKLSIEFVLYRYGRSMEEMSEIGRFPIDYMSYVHMISNTPRYAVIVMYPVIMNWLKMPQHNMHPIETLEKLDEPTKIYLMDLKDGSVLDGFVTDDPSMVFATHIMNAWEEGGDVVFDLATNPWNVMVDYMDLETMMNHPETDAETSETVMKRVRLTKETREVVVEDWPNLSEVPMMNTMDFPVINENYSGYKNRYTYGWVSIDYWKEVLAKKDLEDSSNYKLWFTESHYPGELFFIPNPAGTEEDDGVLVTIVFDGKREQSYLLLLDGKTFTEINRSYLPYNVPFSFHGNWFPELH